MLGLTHAELKTRTRMTARTVSEESGRVCAVPSLQLTIGINNFQVYLARELTDSCRRAIVDAHEMEHVTIWRTHLRAGAQLLTEQLRQDLAEPVFFDSPALLKTGLTQHVEAKVARQLRALMDGIRAAHAELDSAASYQQERNRLNACPPSPSGDRSEGP